MRGSSPQTSTAAQIQPWPLPPGWIWEKLVKLGTWTGGGTPSKSNAAYWMNGDVPWVSPKDMKADTIGKTKDTITSAAVEGSSAKYIAPGSVIMVMRSGILRHSFPVAVTDRTVTLNQDLRALTPYSAINARFIFYYLTYAARRVLNECSKDGTTVNSIEATALERLLVPIPPLPEQRRIVARIDELFAEVANGEAAIQLAQGGLDIFRRALFKAAMSGDLTRDWRETHQVDETGHQVLARIKVERALQLSTKRRGRRNGDAKGPIISGSPPLPTSWASTTLEEVGEVVSGQTPSGIESRTSNQGEIPWFKVSSMNGAGDDGTMTQSAWYLSETSAKELGLRLLPTGTICFPKRGGSILTNKKRRLGVVGALDLNVMGYIPHGAISEFSWLYFLNLDLKSLFDGSNVPQINYGDVAHLPFPIPPPDEAVEISRRVIAALSTQSDTQVMLTSEVGDASRLRQSILKAAFEGRLVPQDSADEPVSVLLARPAADGPGPTRRRRRAA